MAVHRLLDGEPVAPEVQRLMLIHRLCEAYRLSPLEAQRELDHDPEHLAITLLDLAAYIEAKQAFDRATNKVGDLSAWAGSPYMTLVETHTFELHRRRLERDDG